MIPHKQIVMHDPANGRWGDCMRTCLASLMNEENVEDVPHFWHDGCAPAEFWSRVENWLHTQGFHLFSISIHGMLSLDECLSALSHSSNRAAYFMLTGESPRTTNGEAINHVVICQGGRIVHDPHPDNGGLAGPSYLDNDWYAEWLIPISHTTFGDRDD